MEEEMIVSTNREKALARCNLTKTGRHLARVIREGVTGDCLEQAMWWTLTAMTGHVAAEFGIGKRAIRSVPGGFEISEGAKSTRLFLILADASLETIRDRLEKGLEVEADILVPTIKSALAALESVLPFLESPLFTARICRPCEKDGVVYNDAHRITAKLARWAMKKGGPGKAAKGQLRMYRLLKGCLEAWAKGAV